MDETTIDNYMIMYTNQENAVQEKIDKAKKVIDDYENKSEVYANASKYWYNIRIYGICIVCSVLMAKFNIIDAFLNIKHILVLLGSAFAIDALGKLVANYYTHYKLDMYVNDLDLDLFNNSDKYSDSQEILLKEQDKLKRLNDEKDKFMKSYYNNINNHSNRVEEQNNVVSNGNTNIARRVLKPNNNKE